LINGTDDSAKMLGFMEFELYQQGLHADPGYFLLRGLLPLLILGKLDQARIFLNHFTTLFTDHDKNHIQHAQVILSPQHQLFNYAQTVFQIVEKSDPRYFTSLTNRFQEYLSTDSYLLEVREINAVC
jgi:hypothetical protein